MVRPDAGRTAAAPSAPAVVAARSRRTLPALALVLNGFVWGISWWPFRELQQHGLHPLLATATVYLMSVILLLVVRPGAARTLARYPALWLLAGAAGMTNVGFNWAVTVGDVVRVVLLFYLMPAWSVLLAWPMLGERPTAGSLLRIALAMLGVGIVLKTGDTPWPVPHSLADWLALAGGISFALNNILLRRLHRVDAPGRVLAMFLGGAIMAGATAIAGLGIGFVAAPSAPQPAWALGLALSLGFLTSNIALQYGAARLDAHTTALIMLSEVVFASLSSVALGAAALTARTIAGGLLILVAAAWSALGSPQPEEPGAE